MDEFYKSIRRKSDTQSNKEAIITAKIEFDKKFEPIDFSSILRRINKSEDLKTTFESFLYDINKEKCITISRVFPFKNGNPKGYNYRIDSDHPFTSKKISQEVAEEIVKKCSFIIYFEDFKDRIPDKILINKKSEAFNNDWYEIIDGLFYTTDKNYSIDNFKKYFYPSQLREMMHIQS